MRFTHWAQKLTTEQTNEILTELALVHARRICDGALRQEVCGLLDRADYRGICGLELRYEELSTHDALQLRQVMALFEKRDDLELGVDRGGEALRKFRDTEDLCRQTNDIFRMRAAGGFLFPPAVERRIFSASRKIAQILGDVPSLSDLKVRFGPGATTQVPKRKASVLRKLSQAFACSEDMVPIVDRCLEELPSLIFQDDEGDAVTVPVEIHPGKLTFVPKSWKTDRAIVVEPYLNGMFQLGVGDYIAKRLLRFGIDLQDQTPNQRAAREGSITGALATLDLSSASDTIAKGLVLELLPIDWVYFLDSFRTSKVVYGEEILILEKFSANGNGYTFPLETLIFYSLALTCVEKEDERLVRVYGDDIIIPSYAFEDLCVLLRCVGFIPNEKKSFATGSFRESCGADYKSGINIRPVYQKRALYGFDIFRLHNNYVRSFDDEPANLLLQYIDPSLRKWGPDGFGDGHLVTSAPPFVPYKRGRGWAGYTFETYTFKPKKDFAVLPGDRVYPSYCIYAIGAGLDLPQHEYDKKGRIGVSIPGVRGVKLIKIYTLSN